VTSIGAKGVHLGDACILAATVVWSAGMRVTPLTQGLQVTTLEYRTRDTDEPYNRQQLAVHSIKHCSQ
jgi:hypothetical protein